MKAILKMDFILTKRNVVAMVMSIFIPVLFFLLFSTLSIERAVADEAIKTVALRNYLFSMTAFSMSGFGFFTLPFMLNTEKQSNWFKMISHSPLPIWKYYVSKLVRVSGLFLLAIILNFAVGITVKKIDLPLETWLMSGLLLLACGVFFIAFGLLISLIQSEQLITVIGNLLYFVLAIFGGSWMPVSMFPEWMQSISYVTPTYHINHLISNYVNIGDVHINSVLIVSGYTIIILLATLIIKKRIEVK